MLGLLFCDLIFALTFDVIANSKVLLAPVSVIIWQRTIPKAFLLVSPVAGWIADAWVGRYKVIVTCLFLSLVAWVATYIDFAAGTFEWPNPLTKLALVTGMAFLCSGFAGFTANILPFMLDQHIGASSDELSNIVHWYYWFRMLAICVYKLLSVAITSNPMLQYVKLLLAFALNVLVIAMMFILRRWLNTHHRVSNPIKQVASVLNYAMKTKYPQNRSAFTYLDEEQPSRLDFGKEKFGGPFSDEEVEDVRTVLHLMPLLICLVAAADIESSLTLFKNHMNNSTTSSVAKVLFYDSQVFLVSLIAVVYIPVVIFALHPLLYKYIPSMLRRVGYGILLCLAGLTGFLVIDIVGHVEEKSAVCLFQSNISSSLIPVDFHFSLIPSFLEQVGVLLIQLYSFEFMTAQAPAKMKGFIIGLWYRGQAFFSLIFDILATVFQKYYPSPLSSPISCGTGFLLAVLCITMLASIAYWVLARCYKLRERDREVNIYAIVEEHYERYFDQEEEYMRERELGLSVDVTEVDH